MRIQDAIVNDIYNSGWLKSECKKICDNKDDLRGDLFQEIVLIILESKDDSAVVKAFNKGEHLPFIKKVIMNQFNSTTSPFYKQYKKFKSITKNTDEEYGNSEEDQTTVN